MFIRKKDFDELKSIVNEQEKQIATLKKDLKGFRSALKKQLELNKAYDEGLAKIYISTQSILGKTEEEQASMVDEWLNGPQKKE